MLSEAATSGDQIAEIEVDHIADSLSIALCNVLALFHPKRIAIGGGVALMGNTLLNPVRSYVEERVFGVYKGHYSIEACALEEDVVLAGALLLADTMLS